MNTSNIETRQAELAAIRSTYNYKGANRMYSYPLSKKIGIITAVVYEQMQMINDNLMQKNTQKIADNDFWFSCSASIISKRTGLEIPAAKKHIRKLIKLNLIHVRYHSGKPSEFCLNTNMDSWGINSDDSSNKTEGVVVTEVTGGSNKTGGVVVTKQGGSTFNSIKKFNIKKPRKKFSRDCDETNYLENNSPKNNTQNDTPDNTPKTDQLIPNGSFTPRGRRTTVPGQLPKKLKYTKQEEQFAQKVYENISARFPKHMKKYPWPKVRQEWCIGLHRACNANGGFELVSEAIWWAIQYDTFTQKNMRSLARINKMWKNGSTCIESIISSYASHVLYETSNKRATPKFIWKTVYYTLIERGVVIEQAQLWADEMTEAMEALQQIIECSYRERNVKLNYYWFLEKDFLKIVKQNTIDFDVYNLWNNLPDIIKNFGNELYDQIQAGNVTWLDKSIFSLKNTIEEFCNG